MRSLVEMNGSVMVILDNGFFSSFDCGQRMGAIFLSTLLLQVAIVAGLSGVVRKPNRYGPPVEMIDEPPFFTRRRFIVWAIWAAVFVAASGTCAFLRTTTAVILDGASVVETSCSGPFAGEYRLDRTKLNITFGHDPDWLSKRPLQTAYLAITQSDKPRPIFVHLQGRPGSKELFELAPEAMADYSRYRASREAR